MSKSNKFLVIIFTFLFVALVFEIYYLVFYKYTSSSLNTNVAQLSPTTKPSVIPSETPAYTAPKELSSGNEWLTQDDLDNYRKLIDDNMVTSSILETRYVGTIKDITFSTEKNAKGIEFNVFELQAAIAQKNMSKAIRIIQYFEANPKAGPIQMILPALYNFFSKVYMIYNVSNPDEKTVAGSLGVNPYFVKDYIGAAKKYDFPGVEKILLLLHHYNLRSVGVHDGNTTDAGLMKEMTVKMMV